MDFDLNIPVGLDDFGDSLSGNSNFGEFGSLFSGGETDESVESYSAESVDLDSILNGKRGDGNAEEVGDVNSGEKSLTLPEVEAMIRVGCAIDTLDEVFVLYATYARMIGFSARVGSNGYFNDRKTVSSKAYHCSCEGHPDKKASTSRIAAFKKHSYRSNCKARLRVSRADVDSPWVVTVFFKEHNHELAHPSESYLLRSARKIEHSQKTLLMAMKSSGIGVSRAYRFLEKEAGNRENIGFTRKDVYNELNRESAAMAKSTNGDVNKLMEYLTEKGLGDPAFYWKVKVSDDGRLQNLFFRDSRCLVDYQHFGDVISVDATYKTNKYDLICVPIVGINHHRMNVMFGIAFLCNEKTESYEWLFATFLESMYNKEPSIIFSDQDQALMNGVDVTFRDAKHRLCQWHINKNAGKQFGRLNHDKHFKSLWYRCMNGCENDEEFESSWTTMMEDFNLVGNRWFSGMYKLKKRWSSAFTRDRFTGGLHATSRSEATNKVLKELCRSTTSVHEFVVGFERLQRNWRTQEFEEDALCRGMPGMFIQNAKILFQIGEVCTRNIFKLFEYEALYSVSLKVSQEPIDLNDELLEFKVCSSTAFKGYRVVNFNQTTKMGSCSCCMWETEGIICRHLFRVYFNMNLDKVPDQMLLTRWRRVSKERVPLSKRSIDCCGPNKFTHMVFVNHNAHRVYDLLTECKEDKACRDIITERISSMIAEVKGMRKNSQPTAKAGPSRSSLKEPLHRPVNNPTPSKKRSYRRRIVSKNWDARRSGAEKRSKATVDINDFVDSEDMPEFLSNQYSTQNDRVMSDRFSVD
ncbi:protein FAR1-RELATED SEQUENCE 5-like [Salvia miltiorrhiza]|uniref:protein FAR1-RELATED SEQUENCE 5-like n=1 Tax=Salvia miltiorrhiza TaxID=226208 RepID=UPI0025AD8DA4|nr:protein FAR1-RELATED SEQUENCE 5-like [Salvia miltiorrhiza]